VETNLLGSVCEDLSIHRVNVSARQVRLLASVSDDGKACRRESLSLHCLLNAVSYTSDLLKNITVARCMLNDKHNVGSSWNVVLVVKGDLVQLVEHLVGGWYLATHC